MPAGGGVASSMQTTVPPRLRRAANRFANVVGRGIVGQRRADVRIGRIRVHCATPVIAAASRQDATACRLRIGPGIERCIDVFLRFEVDGKKNVFSRAMEPCPLVRDPVLRRVPARGTIRAIGFTRASKDACDFGGLRSAGAVARDRLSRSERSAAMSPTGQRACSIGTGRGDDLCHRGREASRSRFERPRGARRSDRRVALPRSVADRRRRRWLRRSAARNARPRWARACVDASAARGPGTADAHDPSGPRSGESRT